MAGCLGSAKAARIGRRQAERPGASPGLLRLSCCFTEAISRRTRRVLPLLPSLLQNAAPDRAIRPPARRHRPAFPYCVLKGASVPPRAGHPARCPRSCRHGPRMRCGSAGQDRGAVASHPGQPIVKPGAQTGTVELAGDDQAHSSPMHLPRHRRCLRPAKSCRLRRHRAGRVPSRASPGRCGRRGGGD